MRSLKSTVIHHPGRLPMLGLPGDFGARAARKIRAAIEKGKKTRIEERSLEIALSVETDEEGYRVARTDGSVRRLQLGSGHLYRKTTNAELFWRVLGSISCAGDGGTVLLDAEPAYHSSAAMRSGSRIEITTGSSTLVSALREPLDRAHHAAIKETLRLLFGAEFSMREVVLALPCDAAMLMAGMRRTYAVPSPVPLHDLVVLNDCNPDVLLEFCIADAPAENMVRGGGLEMGKLVEEMAERVRGMDNSVEMPGGRW
ncbi:MAG: hypothetical protein AB1657_03985 [Candidatus Micrarchaeota archaeon]